jgi:spore coat polysaccharide biosynthesis protein SpsF
MTALILQGRIDSSRLPEKTLLALEGKPLILRVMEALKRVPCELHILACPEDSLSRFAPLAEQAGFALISGSKEDVLSRYCGAIRRFSPDRIIRATADNPFVFTDAAEAIHREALLLNADYAAYSGLPYGAGVEAAASEALFRAEREAAPGPEREHVCPYLYGHPELFRLHRPLAPPAWQGPSIRITVDTGEDYERAKLLCRALDQNTEAGEPWGAEKIIALFKKTFPPSDTPSAAASSAAVSPGSPSPEAPSPNSEVLPQGTPR